MDLVSKTSMDKNNEILDLLKKHKHSNEFIHAIYAIDVNRMRRTYEQHLTTNPDFNPNMADISYCFTWFKPSYRNLPKFLLEIALETSNDAIIEFLLSIDCDVNCLNSQTGNPLYFLAFEKKYSSFKTNLLKNANFFVKNYRAQSVLFHIIELYVSLYEENNVEAKKDAQVLVDDFRAIITNAPLLITHRDQENNTYTEMIITLAPNNYKKALVFLRETSDLILKILNEKNYEIFQRMIYQSYGLILMNSFIFLNDGNNSSNKNETTQTTQHLSLSNAIKLKKYILDNDLKELLARSETFENNYSHKIHAFNAIIKIGDLEAVKKCLNTEGNSFLITSRDYSGRSCLHLAVLFGQPNIAS